MRTPLRFVSYQRLSPQFQFSLSASALAIYKYISKILYVMDGPYRLPFCSVPVALTGAAQLRADGISSCCYIVNVHNHPSLATSRKEGMAWYSCRPMPSLWFEPLHSERVRSGCIGISGRNGWYNSAYTLYGIHCKDTIPKIWNKYSQEWNCVASFQIPTSLTDTWMWKLGIRPNSFLSGNT
jgi:hypothetical protein